MSTTYSMTGTGSNPKELEKARELENKLADFGITIPSELSDKINRLEKDDVLFQISTGGQRPKAKEGITVDEDGATVDLSKFPGVKFVRFSFG